MAGSVYIALFLTRISVQELPSISLRIARQVISNAEECGTIILNRNLRIT